MKEVIYLAADHAGFKLKEELAQMLLEMGYDVRDKRAFEEQPDDDYPALVRLAVGPLSLEKDAFAIVLGGSGQGEAMTANRIAGVRAAVYYGGPLDIVRLSREHNNANVLSLGARFLSFKEAEEAVKLWLATPFSGEERHQRRISEIDSSSV